MKDIDWSKAPEGATHYGPGGGAWFASWYIVGENTLATMLDDGMDDEWESREINTEDRFSLIPSLISRPVTPQWNGTGLPPVGVVCEFMWNYIREGSEYVLVRVLAHDGESAILRVVDGDNRGKLRESSGGDCGSHPMLRPIRTPEQIAAEERANQIADMEAVFLSVPPGHGRMAALYDAGYRMTAEDER